MTNAGHGIFDCNKEPKLEICAGKPMEQSPLAPARYGQPNVVVGKE